jgi:hypothetical protein
MKDAARSACGSEGHDMELNTGLSPGCFWNMGAVLSPRRPVCWRNAIQAVNNMIIHAAQRSLGIFAYWVTLPFARQYKLTKPRTRVLRALATQFFAKNGDIA